jgi:hypothetical protein
MVVQAASCHPNPCQATPPSDVFACCIARCGDDGDQGDQQGGDGDGDQESSHKSAGVQCEVRSADSCSAGGGITTAAKSCDPNPCNAGSPSGAFLDGNLTL